MAFALVSGAQAETILQTSNPSAGVDWNQSSVWGGNAVSSGNDYESQSGLIAENPAEAFTVNGTTWNFSSSVRDSLSTSTFAGNRLILDPNTRLLGKVQGGGTSTANILLNGGYIQHAGNDGNNGSGTLDGTISFAGGITLGAIGMLPNNGTLQTFTFNVHSTIFGGPDTTLQLTMNGGAARTSHLNLTGDLSNFSGTLYLSTATSGVNVGSSFSIATGSVDARLELNTASSGFSFNLNSNLTFESVLVGTTELAAGTYTFSDLNNIAAGSFLDNGGTITVVPEPSQVSLCVVGLVAVFFLGKRLTAAPRA